MITTTCLLLISSNGWAQGQYSNPNQLIQKAELSPLEVIRNINDLLGATKIEATQAGRGKAFNDKINVAKSFVHAGKIEEAKKAYDEAVHLAWHRG